MDIKTIDKFIKRLNELKSERSNWNNSWQIISEYVNTKKTDFTSTNTQGDFLNSDIYDNTAQMFMKSRASTLKSMVFGNYDFKLTPTKKFLDNQRITEFFTKATEILKYEMKKPTCALDKALIESEEFDATFGTSIIYCDFKDNLRYKCLELKECYLDEDYTTNVDSVYRNYCLNLRQAEQQFGLNALHSKTQNQIKKGDVNDKLSILNAIVPIKGYEDLFDIKGNDFTYISFNIDIENKHLLSFEGYNEMPFMVSREGKKTGEKYGRSPSFDAISTIILINKVKKNIITLSDRQAEPPLATYNDINAINLTPASISQLEVSTNSQQPTYPLYPDVGNPQYTIEYHKTLQDEIKNFYGIDRLLDFNSSQQMTAYEVQQRSIIRNQTLSYLFTSKINDKYTPLILRSFNLLLNNNIFDELVNNFTDIIDILSNNDVFEVQYYNQVEREKNSQDNLAIMNVWQMAGQIVQIKQDTSVCDTLDADKTIQAFKSSCYTNEIFVGEPIISDIREERTQQQQALMQYQATQETLKNTK